MSRVFNFSAGPAAIPDPVMAQIKADLPDWNGIGMSVMEVSHRNKEFIAVAQKAEQDFRELLAIPAEYSVLFLQGGATLQFAMAPLNLSSEGQVIDYIQTGSWSKKAIAEARKYCTVNKKFAFSEVAGFLMNTVNSIAFFQILTKTSEKKILCV